MTSIDKHPLRYSPLRDRIERVLFRRALEGRLDGYTLETSIEIAEEVLEAFSPNATREYEEATNRD